MSDQTAGADPPGDALYRRPGPGSTEPAGAGEFSRYPTADAYPSDNGRPPDQELQPSDPPPTDPPQSAPPASDPPASDQPASGSPAVGEPEDWAEDDYYPRAGSMDDTDPLGFPPIFVAGATIPGLAAPAPEPPDRRRRRRRRALAFSVTAVVLILLSVAILAVSFRTAPSRDASAASPRGDAQTARPTGTPGQGDDPLTAPRQGRQTAVFSLADGASDVRVRAGGLGDDLYRISVPAGSGLAPWVKQQDDEVTLFLPAHGNPGPGPVEIVLNASVRWSLRMDGGADESVIDMTGGSVRDLDLAGGAARIDVTLPRPSSPVVVRMTGGVNRFTVRLADATPVRVQALAGAGQVTIGGTTHQGIVPGQSFTANSWLTGAAGVDVQAVAGMGALNVLTG